MAYGIAIDADCDRPRRYLGRDLTRRSSFGCRFSGGLECSLFQPIAVHFDIWHREAVPRPHNRIGHFTGIIRSRYDHVDRRPVSELVKRPLGFGGSASGKTYEAMLATN